MTRLMEGAPVAATIERDVERKVDALADAGVTPTLATVLMSDDAADRRFMGLKRRACEAHGVESVAVDLDPAAPATDLYDALDRVAADTAVDAVFVQAPLPDHVDLAEVRERIPPGKDVDCFHPRNLGRLVRGDPRFVPATPLAVTRLLEAYDVDVAGRDVTVVGRSAAIGRPLANLLVTRDATVTVCHSNTVDLAGKTGEADVVITACGVPGLVDGSMLAEGASVVDVSANRVETAGGYEVVGDVDFESARERAAAITPVPGGVGPVTLAALLENVATAARRRTGELDG